VQAGLVAFAATATGNDLSAVAPFGGAKGSLGTNPLGWGIPRTGDQAPIIADISTGAASIGEMQMARGNDDSAAQVDASGWANQSHPSNRRVE
jgi:LDH2 family malate/lactate/ureidoglycolate dehydrogenase